MPAKASTPDTDALFGERPTSSRAAYDTLLAALRELGPVEVEPKKTCVHVVAERDGTAFAGIHPRKNGVLLTLRTETAIVSPRVRKTEQASRNRHHNDLLVASPADVDGDLKRWLAAAYALVK
jgi:hypothetical protein